jgi:hypothetical protein
VERGADIEDWRSGIGDPGALLSCCGHGRAARRGRGRRPSHRGEDAEREARAALEVALGGERAVGVGAGVGRDAGGRAAGEARRGEEALRWWRRRTDLRKEGSR